VTAGSNRSGPYLDIPGNAKLVGVQRLMVGFEPDEHGDWVALLECGHRQHVRHRPPWQERPWVVSAEGRESRVGRPLECLLCEAATETAADAESGDPACWVEQVCPECGAVRGDGPGHRAGCSHKETLE
jgi:hypothetical protein